MGSLILERRCPDTEDGAIVAEFRFTADSGSRQEYGGTVSLRCAQLAVLATAVEIINPLPRATVEQLLQFLICWHAPSIAPVGSCSVVLVLQHHLVICDALFAIDAVFCEIIRNFKTIQFLILAPLVCTP